VSAVGEIVQSVERAFRILLAFDEGRGSLSAGEIAATTGLARPTTYRLLQTLHHLGFVRHVDGRFELTPYVLRLSSGYLGSNGLARRAQPVLDRLTETVGEHTSIAVLDGDEVVSLASSNSPRSRFLAVAVQVGQRLPADRSSLGRVLLAHAADRSPDAEPPAVREDYDRIVAQGYAINDGLIEPGLRAIAAPVRDHAGNVVASVAIAVNASQVSLDELCGLYPALSAAARELTAMT
jgi:IclR family pca regulon transcriptional regulator